ncbi:MAG TPA: hypothetical protein VFO03_08955, partial [Gaiellaceae bacterium]|nr:hypothetical protein [Gaiellaceae bacterium]
TEGTRRLYSVDDAGLAELDAWISRFWTNRLDHRGLPPGAIAGYGAGWHSHLDSLEAHLAGGEADCSARFASWGRSTSGRRRHSSAAEQSWPTPNGRGLRRAGCAPYATTR